MENLPSISKHALIQRKCMPLSEKKVIMEL